MESLSRYWFKKIPKKKSTENNEYTEINTTEHTYMYIDRAYTTESNLTASLLMSCEEKYRS